MMDVASLHVMLQFPSAVTQIMVAVLLLMRSRWVMRHSPHADPRVTLYLGLMMLVLGKKQVFWLLHGSLIAADLHAAAAAIKSHWFPIVGNGCVFLFGSLLIARVGEPFIGRRSYAVASMVAVCLLGIGSILATWS